MGSFPIRGCCQSRVSPRGLFLSMIANGSVTASRGWALPSSSQYGPGKKRRCPSDLLQLLLWRSSVFATFTQTESISCCRAGAPGRVLSVLSQTLGTGDALPVFPVCLRAGRFAARNPPFAPGAEPFEESPDVRKQSPLKKITKQLKKINLKFSRHEERLPLIRRTRWNLTIQTQSGGLVTGKN